ALLAGLVEPQNASPRRREREALPVPLALLTSIALLGYGLWGWISVRPLAAPLRQASVAARHGGTEATIQNLRQMLARQPANPGARAWLFNLLVRQRRYSEAVQEYMQLSRGILPPDQSVSLGMQLAFRLTQARQGAEAEAVYRRVLELDPDN